MRRLLLVVLLATVLAVAGCSGPPQPVPTSPPPLPNDVLVQLDDDLTEAGRDAIEERLQTAPGVGPVTFATREQNYQRFRELYRDRPDLLEGVSPDDMADTFRARFFDRAEADSAAAAVRELAGVAEASVLSLPTPTATPS
ncbi:permease-like cell division protein FtsX [Microlunatus speluncae]|uniref:permease-like cell division protein FtsX n=1 Tax=Microlunatus speluncae TaxID=2594267 RepID=UPI001266163F|nr:permease-like cell division protein FtsX [Microlunatus speluncae]